jgi:hypothetical protein
VRLARTEEIRFSTPERLLFHFVSTRYCDVREDKILLIVYNSDAINIV